MRNNKIKNKLPLKEQLKEFFWVLIVIILLPLILIYVLIYGIWYFIFSRWLTFLVKLRWYPRGKKLLFVYSNSPNWKEYIENNVLPKISEKAIVINWSERNEWDWENKSLELRVFQHWTRVVRYFHKGKKKWDGREFNPVAITFVPWWRVKVFRFWKPFKDFKHGKDKKLNELESKLYKTLSMTDI